MMAAEKGLRTEDWMAIYMAAFILIVLFITYLISWAWESIKSDDDGFDFFNLVSIMQAYAGLPGKDGKGGKEGKGASVDQITTAEKEEKKPKDQKPSKKEKSAKETPPQKEMPATSTGDNVVVEMVI